MDGRWHSRSATPLSLLLVENTKGFFSANRDHRTQNSFVGSLYSSTFVWYLIFPPLTRGYVLAASSSKGNFWVEFWVGRQGEAPKLPGISVKVFVKKCRSAPEGGKTFFDTKKISGIKSSIPLWIMFFILWKKYGKVTRPLFSVDQSKNNFCILEKKSSLLTLFEDCPHLLSNLDQYQR